MSQSFEGQPEWKAHFDRGMSAGASGDLEEASGHFAEAAELAPDEPYPHYEFGYTLSLLGRYNDALAAFRRTDELSPGFFLVQTEIYLCEQVLAGKLDESSLQIIRRIQGMMDSGAVGSAASVCLSRQVVDAVPDCALGHYLLGKSLFETDKARAELELRSCVELSPDDTTAIDAKTHIGLLREAAGDLDGALETWTDVLARYWSNPHTELTRAIMGQRMPAEEGGDGSAPPASGGGDMERQLTDEEILEHNRLYEKGWSLVEGELLVGAGPPRKVGRRSRKKLQEATACFEGALDIAPDNWQSMWALGKIHQRLGEESKALDYFTKAHELDPSQVDVAREAGIAATELGDGPAAVRFTRAAIAAKPDDAGLVSNLALAHLIAGSVQEAQITAVKAVSKAPDDPVAKAVRDLVEEVAQGKRPCPKSGRELR